MIIELTTPPVGFPARSGDIFYRPETGTAFILAYISGKDVFRATYFADGSHIEYSYPQFRSLIESLGYKRCAIEKLVLKPAV